MSEEALKSTQDYSIEKSCGELLISSSNLLKIFGEWNVLQGIPNITFDSKELNKLHLFIREAASYPGFTKLSS